VLFKKTKTEIIVFKARNKTEYENQYKPFPASQAVPDWWKNMSPFEKSNESPEGKKFIIRNRASNASFKKCVPMLDAITSGYIVPLWADVSVTPSHPMPNLNWRTHAPIFESHGSSTYNIPVPPGYINCVVKYINTWIPMTPPGYSVLITAPFGVKEPVFLAIPAIIDSDKNTSELVFPMWIKEGFEGIVEAGTPLVQITPFKRTNWKSEFDYYLDNTYQEKVLESNFNRTIVGHYLQKVWSKKSYK
jgi:hypothetical protein